MSIRKTIVALVLVGAAVPAAFASSGVTQGPGYRDFQYHATNSTKTRAEVQQETEAFRKNPLTADGTKILNTGTGFASPQHSYALQGGSLVHTDTIAHNTRNSSLGMTDADKRLNRELYSR